MGVCKTVTSVEISDEECEVFDIQVEHDESFIIAGVVAHNSEVCKAYAFKIWDRDYNPVGHRLPFNGGVPRHINCRSRIVLYEFDDGPSSELTFRQWMARLTPEQQEKVFGKERLKLWRAGKLTDQDLIRSQELAIKPENLND